MSLDPEINRLYTQVARMSGELRGVLLAVASLHPDDLTPAYRQQLLVLYERIKLEAARFAAAERAPGAVNDEEQERLRAGLGWEPERCPECDGERVINRLQPAHLQSICIACQGAGWLACYASCHE